MNFLGNQSLASIIRYNYTRPHNYWEEMYFAYTAEDLQAFGDNYCLNSLQAAPKILVMVLGI